MNDPAILINSRSGTVIELGRDEVERLLVVACKEAGLGTSGIRFLEPDVIADEIASTVSSGVDRILVGGGDGTISTAASHCIRENVVLGPLPLGTCNFFARDCGIPIAIEEAARRMLLARETRSIDLGEVNGRVFINAASMGAYPEAVAIRERARENTETYRWSALSLQLLDVLRNPPMQRVRSSILTADAWEETPFLFVGNNRFSTRLSNLAHREALTEGVLHAVLTDWTTYGGLASILLNSLAGDATNSDAVTSELVRELEVDVEGDEALLTLDGERTRFSLPLRFRSLPGALKVPALDESS